MDVTDIVSTDYEEFPRDAPISKLVGSFDDPSTKGIVVQNDGTFEGVVTRRQLAASHRPPAEKAGSLVWHVPRIASGEDVREVARLMIDGDSKLLPAFEGDDLVGVVTADAILEAVQPFLDAATVGQAYSPDLVVVQPETTFGEALHVLRAHRITHLPVVEEDAVVGIVSLSDVTALAVRESRQSQGGEPGFDPHGAESSAGGYGSHGGFGAREGERARMLDLPVRDVMVSPARTIRPTRTLREAVEEMFDVDGSSLVVESPGGEPRGIVTKTDVLRALTWGAEGTRAVQVVRTDLLDDVSYDEVVAMVDRLDDVGGEMELLDATLHLHEHDEKLRGTPLLLARIRLSTDRGLFVASAEGYGASHAINEARHVLERRLREEKTYGQSKKHPTEEFWENRFGWWLRR